MRNGFLWRFKQSAILTWLWTSKLWSNKSWRGTEYLNRISVQFIQKLWLISFRTTNDNLMVTTEGSPKSAGLIYPLGAMKISTKCQKNSSRSWWDISPWSRVVNKRTAAHAVIQWAMPEAQLKICWHYPAKHYGFQCFVQIFTEFQSFKQWFLFSHWRWSFGFDQQHLILLFGYED